MLEKTTRVNFLYDFYQMLLTPKQRSYMSLYYLDDYSLGEIAEEYDVSRQAVYDNIKRTEAMLEEYESKLLLFQKFQERAGMIGRLREAAAAEPPSKEVLLPIIDALEELE
ncbi:MULTISPECIES: putative DNA-binding protein [Jeotgalibacillus]|uniref:putative DNA-binding protein n=1 Tax=Jeotgalibacillus TaxID=157226 RepID=UPI001069D1E4|nr:MULTISPECIES: putative DNA-binding protein [Jeotgalibacillus]TFE03525.1 putative DNA-binding protein [Jeotgalibacillus sp. R-1-5s-1]